MSNAIFVGDLIESNGKTVKQNNMQIKHNIPLGTLVEINCDDLDEHGLRLFVTSHDRDCDGTPLYTLSTKKDYQDRLHELEKPPEDDFSAKLQFVLKHELRGSTSGGWGEDSLIVVRV